MMQSRLTHPACSLRGDALFLLDVGRVSRTALLPSGFEPLRAGPACETVSSSSPAVALWGWGDPGKEMRPTGPGGAVTRDKRSSNDAAAYGKAWSGVQTSVSPDPGRRLTDRRAQQVIIRPISVGFFLAPF
ncbi:hypothetical protein S7711_10694 [Stachybotrys chartarum IBT 7711]|uniref:Uncharacterized protein n=1 Tax=Stachybotrys chartarum (strain CBS 109288 / IBT 7711) TaxID=1280523 RepID=A0A084AUP9_STACB|nr:hypothetical protein S7711_10694 [Stachybotrys chartarum IBT 7711]KFA52950.1 hypothetical protein S40293_10436 [Stachybotrys chartarum IBT 40293]